MKRISLFDDISVIRGVGPKRVEAFHHLGIRRMIDLVTHVPRRYEDRRVLTPIGALHYNQTAIILGRLEEITSRQIRPRLSLHKATLSDSSGSISVNFFNQDYILGRTAPGSDWAVFGKCVKFGHDLVFSMKELDLRSRGAAIGLGTILSYYPASSATPQGYMRRTIQDLVLHLDGIEPAPPVYPELPSFADAARMAHMPRTIDSEARRLKKYVRDEPELGRRRLAMDELVMVRICVEQVRRARPPVARAAVVRSIALALPYELTTEQASIRDEIFADLDGSRPMRRLVEGDVGSGKTVLGILAAVHAAERGRKTAFLSPTEILAEQHYGTWREALDKAGLKSHLLMGATPKKAREVILAAAVSDEPAVFFGTHALLSTSVRYERLGLVIVDEQQRFGVAQRDALVRKGEQGGAEPDLLILTATPIPRTLAMTMYGDLEISTLLHRLPGRTGVQTIHLTESQRKQMMPLVRGALARGERIYIVYPIIEEEDEDEENDERPTLKNAKSQHKKIREAFPDANAALLTGQTKSDQKESTMRDFRDGKISILVATSVVEVGIDVPEATLMVIEHAEHFGLAQLHQLRGRVGRGGRPGTCVLTTADNLAEYAAQRIEALLTTQDGFRIAEEDLELRGPGEMLGERQHGGTELRVAQLLTDKDLIPGASDEAQRIMDADPALEAHPFIRGYKESLEAVGADLL